MHLIEEKNDATLDLMSIVECDEVSDTLKCVDSEVVKRSKNSLVIKTGERYVKVSKINQSLRTEVFELILRKAIVEELNEMGLDWTFSAFSNETGLYAVEERQALRVISENNCSKQEVMKKNSEFVKRVEKRLEFPRMMSQIATQMRAEILSLQRDAEFECSDFAWANDEIVPLGNSKYFMTFLHYDGTWSYEASSRILNVTTTRGDFLLARMKLFNPDTMAIEKTHESSSKWWLFDASSGDIQAAQEALITETQEMFQTNLKIVTKKKLLDVKTKDDYFPMGEECRRRGLVGSGPRKSLS